MGKNTPRERTPNQNLVSQALHRPERHKIIEERALHQRPQLVAHPHIGLQALRRAFLEPQRVLVIDGDDVLHVRTKAQTATAAFFLDPHFDRQERHVVDSDANFFDRRNEDVPIAVLAQNRREKLDERRPADRRTAIEPCSVSRDAHVDIAAVGRIPEVHRRAAALTPRRCLPETFERSVWGPCSLRHILAPVCGRICRRHGTGLA